MGNRSTVETHDTIQNLNYLFVKYLFWTTFVKHTGRFGQFAYFMSSSARRGLTEETTSFRFSDFEVIIMLLNLQVKFPLASHTAAHTLPQHFGFGSVLLCFRTAEKETPLMFRDWSTGCSAFSSADKPPKWWSDLPRNTRPMVGFREKG